MKAIQVTCPNCGAKLKVDETSSLVTCEYCGTGSTIQRRTGILERVVPPSGATRAELRGVRYARQQHTSRWIAVIVALPILIGVTAAILGVRAAMNHKADVRRRVDETMRRAQQQIDEATRQAGAATAAARGPDDGLSWQGTDGVLIAGVNGTPELIGRGRRVNAGDQITLIALDLATGTKKWESPPLGTYTDTYRGLLALAGDKVVHVSEKAQMRAFNVKDGTPAWTATLDERVKAFCTGDTPETFRALGNDDKLRPVTIADGTVGPATPIAKKRAWPERPACTELQTDDVTPFEMGKTSGSHATGVKLGLDIDVFVTGPGGTVVSGARSTGTRVTTLVALNEKGDEKWRATGAPDALGSEGAARHVVVGETATCFVYYGSQYRLACLAMADGKRLWDVEAPSFFEGLYIVGTSLVMTTHRQLEVRDLATGAIRWSLE